MKIQDQWALVAWALFAALCLTLILLNVPYSGGLADDAARYHVPQINAFLADPGNLIDYPSYATTLPFYHWASALVARVFQVEAVGQNDLPVRLWHFLLSGAAVFLYARWVALRDNGWRSVVLVIPLMSSWYVVSGAVSLGTDGPGLSAFVLGLSLLAAPRPAAVPSALAALLSVMVRHLYLPALLAATAAQLVVRNEYGGVRLDIRNAVRAGLLLVPAMLLLGFYVLAWGGLTPPGIPQQLNPEGIFLHSITGALAMAGIWGVAFVCLFAERLPPLLSDRTAWAWGAAAALLATLIWAAAPTTSSIDGGRFGSLVWQVSDIVAVGDRSLVVLGLAVAGALSLTLFGLWTWRAGAVPYEVIALTGLIFGLGVTYAAYQRYIEPACIVCLGVTAAQLGVKATKLFPLKAIPLLLLSLLGVAVTAAKTLSALG